MASVLWAAGALILLVFMVIVNFPSSKDTSYPLSSTPMDRTSGSAAAMWRLLWNASEWIPGGESYTVRAKDRGQEMELHMLSLAVLVQNAPLPSSYWGKDLGATGSRARFVIFYQNQVAPGPSERLVRTFPDGSLYRREK
jgi:hypothetical protein